MEFLEKSLDFICRIVYYIKVTEYVLSEVGRKLDLTGLSKGVILSGFVKKKTVGG